LKIFVGLWNFEGGVARAQDRIGPGVADTVVTSLQQAVSLIVETSRGSSNVIQSRGALHPEIVTTTP
jgi:hypothetical protein